MEKCDEHSGELEKNLLRAPFSIDGGGCRTWDFRYVPTVEISLPPPSLPQNRPTTLLFPPLLGVQGKGTHPYDQHGESGGGRGGGGGGCFQIIHEKENEGEEGEGESLKSSH